MRSFWDSTIKPILDALDPRVVVEVGAGSGEMTSLLLEHCSERDAVAHVIEPQPRFSIEQTRERFGASLAFHRSSSLDALAGIDGIELALIDGDHNWYTVFHELELLERGARKAGGELPVCVLHDVDWPYGRRDVYSAPERIPSAYLHPHRRGGLRPGNPEPGEGGYNRARVHAIREGGERNGVRTAIDDFLTTTSIELELFDLPGDHGLAILVPTATLASHPDLVRYPDRMRSSPLLRQALATIEAERVEAVIAREDATVELEALKSRLAEQQSEFRSTRATSESERRESQQLRSRWQVSKASLSRLQGAYERSEGLRLEAERQLADRQDEVAVLSRRLAEVGDLLEVDSKRADRNQRAKDALEERLSAHQERNRGLEDQLKQLEERNRGLEYKLNQLEERNRGIEATLKRFENRDPGLEDELMQLEERNRILEDSGREAREAEKALARAEASMSEIQRDLRQSERLREAAEARVRELERGAEVAALETGADALPTSSGGD